MVAHHTLRFNMILEITHNISVERLFTIFCDVRQVYVTWKQKFFADDIDYECGLINICGQCFIYYRNPKAYLGSSGIIRHVTKIRRIFTVIVA